MARMNARSALLAALHVGAGALAILPIGCSESSNPGAPAPDAGLADAAAPAPTFDFSALETYLFAGSWKTEGVVVMHEGKVVYEKYAAGFDATKRHITYSVSKSIGSALIGIAVQEKLLALTDSVCKHVAAPATADPTLCDTTIGHLLHMSSGLKWTETYDNPAVSNVLPMLYGDEADMGSYVATLPRAAPAGSRWLYSSGDSNLLARALRGALAGRDMRAWAKEKLLDPAGLSSVVFEADRSGTLVFSSSCFMTPRDMARFGQLYLDDGMSGAIRVLPEGWVTFTRTPAPTAAQPTPRDPSKPPGESGGSYGAAFWLNAVNDGADPSTLMYPDAPADTYQAEGHWGQKIFMIPSRKLVVARVGDDRGALFDPSPMLGHAVASITAGSK